MPKYTLTRPQCSKVVKRAFVNRMIVKQSWEYVQANRYISVLWFLIICQVAAGDTFAADRHPCVRIAYRAVSLQVYNEQHRCGIERSRWHLDYSSHFDRCHSQSTTERLADLDAREKAIDACRRNRRERRITPAAVTRLCTRERISGRVEKFGSKKSVSKKARKLWKKRALRSLSQLAREHFRDDNSAVAKLSGAPKPGCIKRSIFPVSYNCSIHRKACADISICVRGYRPDGYRCISR